jgi:hypothetical protein
MSIDRGVWATWYDLPEEGGPGYLDWLHRRYLPAILARPGYLWAAHVQNIMTPEREAHNARRLTHVSDPAVPTGNQYLLLFGAESPHTFADPSPAELLAAADPETQRMLEFRRAPRSLIFVEVDRVNGPARNQRAPGITPGPVVQFGTFNIDALEHETEMETWYARSRLPLVGRTPGAVGARKVVSIAGWAKHGIMYEFESLEAAAGIQADTSDWSRQVVDTLVHAPHSPSLGVRIWPPPPA